MGLSALLLKAIAEGATDIHLESNQEPYFRLGNDLVRHEGVKVSDTLFSEIITASERGYWNVKNGDNKQLNICTGKQEIGEVSLDQVADTRKLYKTFSKDSAFSFQNIRVRVHLYRAKQQRCGTLRILYNQSLAMPDGEAGKLLHRIVHLQEGLVLVTGPTGSGKSYTLATCLQCINEESHKHIITLEDPIEFSFENKQSLIHQRQLGQDMESMAAGVRDALREDPDVIMIGELRDRETLEVALHAAETGHLVFATLHTQRAVMAINRMISVFPASQQEEVRAQLSQVLRAVLCQRLLRFDKNFVVVRDILLNTPAVANLIRQRKEPQIVSIQETQPPMQTMEMAVAALKSKWGNRSEFKEVLEQSYEAI